MTSHALLKGAAAYLTDDVAAAALFLWSERRCDTATIAGILHVPEHAVLRTVRIARDIARERGPDLHAVKS